MTDHFALLGEARRPWLDPEELKEKYHALSRNAPPGAELNEAFRVLSDPKLRLQHLLKLEGADLTAGRPVPAAVAELFWNAGSLLREIERWLLRQSAATSTLARALLQPERGKLESRLSALEEELRGCYDVETAKLRAAPNELSQLVERYDTISYL
ncbi:MAG: hypothetical protein ACREP1_14415, partial [Rhodanobacteraceae bacterium]